MNISRRNKIECSIEGDEKVTVGWLRAFVELIADRDHDEVVHGLLEGEQVILEGFSISTLTNDAAPVLGGSAFTSIRPGVVSVRKSMMPPPRPKQTAKHGPTFPFPSEEPGTVGSRKLLLNYLRTRSGQQAHGFPLPGQYEQGSHHRMYLEQARALGWLATGAHDTVLQFTPAGISAVFGVDVNDDEGDE